MKSMTGYGRAKAEAASDKKKSGKMNDLDLEITIRTVNGRFLESRFHLPREYASIESELKTRLNAVVARGTVDIYVNRRAKTGDPELSVRTGLAKKWVQAQTKLAKDLKIKAEITLEMLQQIPDLISIQESFEISESEKKLVFKLMQEALDRLVLEREREGLSLRKELSRLLEELERLALDAELLKAEANTELERRFHERLDRLGLKGKVDEQRLAQEMVMQLDRSDISEELQRLREHLKAYRLLLKSTNAQGKKLDFYAQELLREVNTMGSKSHLAKLTAIVVEAKTLVEKIREQVQNVE